MYILNKLSLFKFFYIIFLSMFVKNSQFGIPTKLIKDLKILNQSNILKEKQINLSKKPVNLRKLIEPFYSDVKILDNNLLVVQVDIAKSQKFNLILDTDTILTWVSKKDGVDQGHIENHYNPNISPTFTRSGEQFVMFGNDYFRGEYGYDNIKFISDLSCYMKFGVADENDLDVGADGIFSIARNYQSYDYSWIWKMFEKGAILSRSFSIKYINDTNAIMYIGGEHSDFRDDRHTGQCHLLNKTQEEQNYWACKLYTFGLISDDNSKNATALCQYSLSFSTRSNNMVLPLETLDLLDNQLSQFNCHKTFTNKGYSIMCDDKNSLPHIYIEVGNYYLILDSKGIYYEKEFKGSKLIYLNIIFTDTKKPVIGMNFLKFFHTKFDPDFSLLKFRASNFNQLRTSYNKPDHDEARSL